MSGEEKRITFELFLPAPVVEHVQFWQPEGQTSRPVAQ
jgi:hypothetical protein